MKSKVLWLLSALLLFGCAPKANYQPVTPDYTLHFPRDHYAHPDFRIEWWYYSGHLDGADGHTYGFELVFFQRRTEGDWRYGLPVWLFANPAYVAHFAISDLAEERFVYGERLGLRDPFRGGARDDRFHLWSEGWQAIELDGRQYLQADIDDYGIELLLDSTKPPVLHGDHGYSRKGEHGNASYYISYTRLNVKGWLRKGAQRIKIDGGSAWLDHEIMSGSIGRNLSGWDWFSIQLDDGSDLMFFLLRKEDGGLDILSEGTYVDAEGLSRKIPFDDFKVEETDYWISPQTKTRYPVAWKVNIESLDLKLTLRAPLPFSELITGATSVTYWEGAIEVSGQRENKPITGRGYVEMSGRDEPFSEI